MLCFTKLNLFHSLTLSHCCTAVVCRLSFTFVIFIIGDPGEPTTLTNDGSPMPIIIKVEGWTFEAAQRGKSNDMVTGAYYVIYMCVYTCVYICSFFRCVLFSFQTFYHSIASSLLFFCT